MDPFSAFMVFFGCVALLVVVGICFAIFGALFGRRRGYGGYGGYGPRPRFFMPWLFLGERFPRREFYEPRRERFERFEHHEHHDHHHDHPPHGGGFGGGEHHGGHHGHGGGGFGGGGGHHGGGHH